MQTPAPETNDVENLTRVPDSEEEFRNVQIDKIMSSGFASQMYKIPGYEPSYFQKRALAQIAKEWKKRNKK
jgi:hypothetical protein